MFAVGSVFRVKIYHTTKKSTLRIHNNKIAEGFESVFGKVDFKGDFQATLPRERFINKKNNTCFPCIHQRGFCAYPESKTKIDNLVTSDVKIEKWFKEKHPDIPFLSLKKFIRKGFIKVDGKLISPNQIVFAGQTLTYPSFFKDFQHPGNINPPPKDEKIDLFNFWKQFILFQKSIVYEDESFLVINKPQGIAVQNGVSVQTSIDQTLSDISSLFNGHITGVVFSKILSKDQFIKLSESKSHLNKGDERLRLTHRLDKETSGLLIIGKTLESVSWISSCFEKHKIEKHYWAVTVGVPKNKKGIIKGPLDGSRKESISHYKLLKQLVYDNTTKLSFLELRPETGRMHQLRIHCAQEGFPILGDQKYGDKSSNFLKPFKKKPLHLHAFRLSFPSFDGSQKTLFTNIPLHIKSTLDQFSSTDQKIQK